MESGPGELGHGDMRHIRITADVTGKSLSNHDIT